MSVSTSFTRPRPHLRGALTRETVVDALALAGLIAVCGALASVGSTRSIDVFAVVAGLVLCMAAGQIQFAVRGGSATTMQLVFVPLWFAVPPALLPAIAGLGQFGSAYLASRSGPRAQAAAFRPMAALGDGWLAVAPAVLIALWGGGEVSMGLFPLVMLATASQLVVMAGLRGARHGVARGRSVGEWFVAARGAALVDLGLAPLGLVVAVAMQGVDWTVLFVVPLMVLMRQFALERDVRAEQARQLAEAYRGTAALMGDVLEADDEYTGGEHTDGVVAMAIGVGRALELDADRMQTLELGALLHDVGKLRVPNEIINKPDRLTEAEWEIIKQHPAIGEEMLLRVGGALADAAPIVRGHHERYDGGGYPDGLAGEDIPLEARIITVCDSFSAMTTDRSYRKGMSHPEAVLELRRCTPGQFDPVVVAALELSLGDVWDTGLAIASETHPPYGTRGSVAPEGGTDRRAA